MAQIGQGTLDAVVAPGRILSGHSQNQLGDLGRNGRPTRLNFAKIAVIPFRCHWLAMPAKDHIRRDDSRDFLQSLSSQSLALDCQTAALVVAQPDPSRAMGFLEHLGLGQEEVDRRLLLAVKPAGQDDDEELPRLEDEVRVLSADLKKLKDREVTRWPRRRSRDRADVVRWREGTWR